MSTYNFMFRICIVNIRCIRWIITIYLFSSLYRQRTMATKTTGIRALLKQGWNEIPEVLSTGFAAIGFMVVGSYFAYQYNAKGLENKRYKEKFLIMRPDDPRVAKIHKD